MNRITSCPKNGNTNNYFLYRPEVPVFFKAGKSALKKAVQGNEDIVVAITVGSETLYRGNFTGQELLGRLSRTLSSYTALGSLLSLIIFSSFRSPLLLLLLAESELSIR